MTVSRDYPTRLLPAAPATYEDLIRLWQPTRRRGDHVMAVAWFSTLSVMALILVLTLWAIEVVGR